MAVIEYPARESVRSARARYFEANRFGEDGGYGDAWVDVEFGPLTVPIPNTPARVRAVRYHDLHHIVTGYDTNLVGEMEISAWELGAGCEDFVAAYVLNIGGLSGGILAAPRRTLQAFARGRQSRSLYGVSDVDTLLDGDVAAIRELTHVPAEPVPVRPSDLGRFLLFGVIGLFTWGVALVPGLVVGPLLSMYLSRAKAREASRAMAGDERNRCVSE